MEKYIELKCSVCGKQLKRKLKQYKYDCKKYGLNYKPLCHASCGGSKVVSCKTCGKKFRKRNTDIKKTINNFCSHSCSASFNNKKIDRTKTGLKKCKLQSMW